MKNKKDKTKTNCPPLLWRGPGRGVLFFFLLFLSFSSCKTSRKGNVNQQNNTQAEKNSKQTSQPEEKHLTGKARISFEYLFYNATKEKILGNYDSTETLLLQALRLDPNSAAASYELANVYGYKNNKKQSLFYSRKAALLDPKNLWYQLLYIDCLKDNKLTTEIIIVYKKLLKNYPDHIDFYYELGNAYIFIK